MPKVFQRIFLAIGVIAFIALVIEIVLSVGATMHSNTPVRVEHVTAGPYALTVSLYKDPANAGFALPFAIAPQQPTQGKFAFNVTSDPDYTVDATPIHASVSPDPSVPGGVQGAAEITVQGQWYLHIIANGPQGPGIVNVPITATAPPAIPEWLGWFIGLIPLYGLFVFLLMQRGRRVKPTQVLGGS